MSRSARAVTLLVVLAVAAGAAYVVLRASGDPEGPPGRRIDFVLHDDAFTPVAAEDLRSADCG